MPRILVIDDDPAISELVAVNLEMAGYDVSQAPDGIKGQALALQLMPDLIMLDLVGDKPLSELEFAVAKLLPERDWCGLFAKSI